MKARVFCLGPGGGNPVSIFSSDSTLLDACKRDELARGCDWESVFVGEDKTGGLPIMAFYMPTGEQVSFCAHAAIGGSSQLVGSGASGSDSRGRASFAAAPVDGDDSACMTSFQASQCTVQEMISLKMETLWIETPLTDNEKATLRAVLSEHHGIRQVQSNNQDEYPTFCNSSVSRDKTLVQVDYDTLRAARAPDRPHDYKTACDAIHSTGLYLYARHPGETGAWVCVGGMGNRSCLIFVTLEIILYMMSTYTQIFYTPTAPVPS